jgi:hypothetical protein
MNREIANSAEDPFSDRLVYSITTLRTAYRTWRSRENCKANRLNSRSMDPTAQAAIPTVLESVHRIQAARLAQDARTHDEHDDAIRHDVR